MSALPDDLAQDMARRLDRLEAESRIRACLATYMEICDRLDASTDLAALGALFTADCVWEGRGARYGETFGRHEGRAAIVAYLGAYCDPPLFEANAHFLSSERIAVDDGAAAAEGHWLMLQTPTFHDGSSFLMAAKLDIDFRRDGGTWRMAHFRTTNLYTRPVGPWDQPAPLPRPKPPAPEETPQ